MKKIAAVVMMFLGSSIAHAEEPVVPFSMRLNNEIFFSATNEEFGSEPEVVVDAYGLSGYFQSQLNISQSTINSNTVGLRYTFKLFDTFELTPFTEIESAKDKENDYRFGFKSSVKIF